MENVISVPKISSFFLKVKRLDISDFLPSSDVTLFAFTKDVRILVGKRVIERKAKDILICAPFSVCCPCSKEGQAFGYSLSFSEEAFRTLLPSLLLRFSDGMLTLDFPFSVKERLFAQISVLCDERTADFYDVFALLSILEKESIPEMDNSSFLPLPKLLRQALAYLYENHDTEVDVQSLAARYGVSASTLLRAFRKHLGLTPLKYHAAVKRASQAFASFN